MSRKSATADQFEKLERVSDSLKSKRASSAQPGIIGMRTHRILCAAAAAAFFLAGPGALAQSGRVAEVATYQGADRQQRLIEGAKREKELTFYSCIPPEDISALVSAFDKKYGVKVKVWRADSAGFLQRILSEARAR